VTDEFEREVSLMPVEASTSRAPRADDAAPRSPGFVRVRTNPTRADPAVTMMPDQSSFCCWVEPLGDGDRWIFLSSDGATYVGPVYGGEDSLEQIKEALSRWLRSTGRVERYSR
jgi:hypothetical protein